MLLVAAGLAVLAGQGQAYKVLVAPGKTECISQNMEAAHFEVLTLSLGPRTPDGAAWGLACSPLLLRCCFAVSQQVSGAARVEGAVFVSPRYPNYQPSTTLRVR